jgi:hypothetical protein
LAEMESLRKYCRTFALNKTVMNQMEGNSCEHPIHCRCSNVNLTLIVIKACISIFVIKHNEGIPIDCCVPKILSLWKSKVFRPSVASQDLPSRKGIWAFRLKHHSTDSPFPSICLCNQIIRSWNTASKVSGSTPLKISWIADKKALNSSNELPWSTPFRSPNNHIFLGPDLANKEDGVPAQGIMI